MEAFLDALLGRYLPQSCTFRIHSYQGKRDLLSKLKSRLQGYASFLPPDHRIVVIVDRDQAKHAADGLQWQVVTRIAVEELEAWYFGDWQAVCQAFRKVPSKLAKSASYRKPDAIQGGTWEAFERILKKYGYCKQALPKIQTATTMGQHMEPKNNCSPSFKIFWQAISDILPRTQNRTPGSIQATSTATTTVTATTSPTATTP